MPTPAQYRQKYRALAWKHRSLPGKRGLREHAVAIVIGSWTGTYAGRGSLANEILPITEAGGHPPKVRRLNDEELALGQLSRGTIIIGPITPAFTGGGTEMTTLQPSLSQGETRHLLITGPEHPEGALYRITSIDADKALHWMIRAEPVADAEPVP